MADEDDRGDLVELPSRWSASAILLRVAILVFALGFTAAGFYFWGVLGNAIGIYMSLPDAGQPQQTPGEVTVDVLPGKTADCDKDHPCPK